MISKRFITSSFIYSIVGALPLASSIFLLPFYTNMLTTSDFGMLMIYIVFTQLMQLFFNFGLDNYIPISYIENKNNPLKQKECLSTGTITLIFLGVFIIILLLFWGDTFFDALNNLLYNNNELVFFPWGLMSVITAFFNSMFKSYTNLLIYQQRPIRFFWMNSINFILTVGLSVIYIYAYPYMLTGPMWGRLLSGIGIFIVSIFFMIKEFGVVFKKEYLKPIFKFCFPLVLYFIIIWIVGNIDRFIILYYKDASDVAIFDFAVKCTLLIEFIQSGLTSAIQPKIFNIWKDQNLKESTPEVNRYYNGYTAITLFIIPLFLILIPLIVPIVVKTVDYYKSFVFLSILSIGFVMRGLYSMYISPISYFKKTYLLPGIFFVTAIIQIVLNIFLIKNYGLIGAAWTCLIVKCAQVVILYFATKKIFKFKFNRYKLVYLPLIYLFIFLLLELIIVEQYRIYSYLFQFILNSILIYFIYRKEIKLLINNFIYKRNKEIIQ